MYRAFVAHTKKRLPPLLQVKLRGFAAEDACAAVAGALEAHVRPEDVTFAVRLQLRGPAPSDALRHQWKRLGTRFNSLQHVIWRYILV